MAQTDLQTGHNTLIFLFLKNLWLTPMYTTLVICGLFTCSSLCKIPLFPKNKLFFQCLIVVLNMPNHKLFSSPVTCFIISTGKTVASPLRQSNISIWYSVFHIPEVPFYHFPGSCFPIWSCPLFTLPEFFRKLLKTCGSSQPSRIINETTSVSSSALRNTEGNAVQAYPSSSPSIRISNPQQHFLSLHLLSGVVALSHLLYYSTLLIYYYLSGIAHSSYTTCTQKPVLTSIQIFTRNLV